MNYVCIENGAVTGLLNYKPNVPVTVTLVEVTDDEYRALQSHASVFDVENLKVIEGPGAMMYQNRLKMEAQHQFLASTDWKVMRHIREKALGLPTTLTEAEYVALEQERHDISKTIPAQGSV